MKIPTYLAMTAAEFSACPSLPLYTAWMACHFSPYGTDLTNLPKKLPEKALIIINDRTPIYRHDCEQIAVQLSDLIHQFHPLGVLLDFQDSQNTALHALAKNLVAALPCPVCLPEAYAQELDCPVFVSAPPVHKHLSEHLSPWEGREIWLEAALEASQITVMPTDSDTVNIPHPTQDHGFFDDKLFCHYITEVSDDAIRFTLWRTKEDLGRLLDAGSELGVTRAVGLWQELG